MHLSRRISSIASYALLASCAGCAVVGVIAEKVANGPRPVDAEYDPGKTTQLLIVAENFRAPTQNTSDSDRLARLVGDQIASQKAALVVSQEKLELVRDAKPDAFNKMSVVDLGKAVGASKIIYIDLLGVGVGVQSGSDVLKGIGHATVKVIDVTNGTVDFPKDVSDGLPIAYETPMRRSTDTVNADSMRAETLVGLSTRISRLFYKYEPTDMEAMDPGDQ